MLTTFSFMVLLTSSALEALPELSAPLIRKLPRMPGSKVFLYVLQLDILVSFSILYRRFQFADIHCKAACRWMPHSNMLDCRPPKQHKQVIFNRRNRRDSDRTVS
jgi:hypothetical protein